MRMTRLKKLVGIVSLGGCLFASTNCLPTRNQINASLNGGLMSGIELAITLAITNLLVPETTTTDTTTTG